jgi:peptide deformylase
MSQPPIAASSDTDRVIMAILNILEYPDPRLRTRAHPVAQVDDRIRRLVDDMFETMYDAPGVGLAATQVDVHERVLVADVSDDRSSPLCLINPEIVEEKIRVRALDRDGRPLDLEADGLLAVCIQHEMDHLDGKLFVDYLSELKRQRIRKRLEKAHRLGKDDGESRRQAVPVI